MGAARNEQALVLLRTAARWAGGAATVLLSRDSEGVPMALRAAKTDDSHDRALVGRPFQAASRLSSRLSGRTLSGVGIPSPKRAATSQSR